jgi:transcriptional regulator with XRE-family HTH domain
LTPVDRHVARRIKGKRLALGLSEDEVATALGIGRDRVEEYERAHERVPAELLLRLSEVLGVPISYFFPRSPCLGD